MTQEPIIKLENVDICFYVRESGHISLKEFIFKPGKYKLLQKQFVLRDISFEIYRGESVGLLGRNGSGKSTLLRALSGIITPDKGKIHVNGKVAPLLGLGIGLEQEMTGIENIKLSCALMGLSKAETKELIPEIIEFSELGETIDWAVKRYSTGMMSRLSFSIAIMKQPDILLIDEVLAVGDKGFQEKCLQKVNKLKSIGTTVVYVSHSMSEVSNMCSKAALLNNGHLEMFGDVQSVGDKYLQLF
ncbi:MAG: ABC transporter ATP-binding protein [Bacteroidetes bacterium]|nr:ABC transporter ATP-binding protein [Bacteroidota bacterium]